MKIFTNIQLKFYEILVYKTLKFARRRVLKNMQKSVFRKQVTQIFLKICFISKVCHLTLAIFQIVIFPGIAHL